MGSRAVSSDALFLLPALDRSQRKAALLGLGGVGPFVAVLELDGHVIDLQHIQLPLNHQGGQLVTQRLKLLVEGVDLLAKRSSPLSDAAQLAVGRIGTGANDGAAEGGGSKGGDSQATGNGHGIVAVDTECETCVGETHPSEEKLNLDGLGGVVKP
jgi:hypothetical protein